MNKKIKDNIDRVRTKLSYLTLLILTFGLMAGCAANKQFIKTYEGEPLALSESALLKPVIGIIIYTINGKPITEGGGSFTPVRAGLPNIDAEISLTPGNHTLVLGFFTQHVTTVGDSVTSTGQVTFTFNAKPDRKYLLIGQMNSEKTRWRPSAIDVTDKPELWRYDPKVSFFY